MKKYSLFLILSLFLAVSSVKAQENLSNEENTLEEVDFDELPAKIRLPYAYPFTLEWNIGHSRNLKSYSRAIPDRGLSGRADTRGVDMTWRFTGFFSKHWGAFASANVGVFPVSAGKTERTLHENNGRYEYINLIRQDCWYYDCGAIFDSESQDGGGASSIWLLAGPAYRYDFSRWSVRARLGLGYGEIFPETARYLRGDLSLSGKQIPELVEIEYFREKNERRRHGVTGVGVFAYSPSVQITYTVRRHFYFAFEMSFIGNVGHYYERIQTFSMKETQKNGGWLGDLIHTSFFPFVPSTTPEFEDAYYEKDQKLSTEFHRLHPGNLLNFNLGVGWNIGHNRNERKRTNR